MIFNSYFLFKSLNDLAEFIKVTDVGLTKDVPEGDYNGLVDVMGHLMAVKDRTATTDEMFEPLKHTIELLRSYDQELSEETHSLLQVHHRSLIRNSHLFFFGAQAHYLKKAVFGCPVDNSQHLLLDNRMYLSLDLNDYPQF